LDRSPVVATNAAQYEWPAEHNLDCSLGAWLLSALQHLLQVYLLEVLEHWKTTDADTVIYAVMFHAQRGATCSGGVVSLVGRLSRLANNSSYGMPYNWQGVEPMKPLLLLSSSQ
jgi:hypothetical protein